MVKIDNSTNPNNQTETFGSQTSGSQTQPNNPFPKKEESGIIKIIGQLLPLAPFAFEQFTGQKVPQMSGTIAEMQMVLINIQSNLQTMANHQQSLNQRLIGLESKLSEVQTNANNHLTNLTNQFKSLRLTHTKEQKQIEYNPNQENQEEY